MELGVEVLAQALLILERLMEFTVLADIQEEEVQLSQVVVCILHRPAAPITSTPKLREADILLELLRFG
tara:strand:+ start:470 stop:676 length:207 start_codon:yes stop_codon:yes gene_type:complete